MRSRHRPGPGHSPTSRSALVKVDIRRDTLSDPALAFGPRLAKGALAFVLNDPGPYGCPLSFTAQP